MEVKQKTLAGFSSDKSLLYVRDETVALWDVLCSGGDTNVSVDGPPGTGKSTEVWAWALWKAYNFEVEVTWYHITTNRIVKVVIDGSTKRIATTDVAKLVEDMEDCNGSILIVDGVKALINSNIRQACSFWRSNAVKLQPRRFVLVSSGSTTVAVQEDEEATISNFTVGSWTLQQYQDACEDEAFFEQVQQNLMCPGSETVTTNKDQLVLSKYFYAGGCARWMFEFTYIKFLNDFTRHLTKVTNYALLFEGQTGEQNAVAVNHLRGLTIVPTATGVPEYKYFFISQYAIEELAKKCDDKRKFLINSYKKAVDTENPAFKGWVFEFDVDYQLSVAFEKRTEFCASIRSLDGTGTLTEDRRPVHKYIVFESVENLSRAIGPLAIGDVLWAKPKLWCQKAYDFVCFWKYEERKLNMVVANATVASTHSVLLNEVNKLATGLGENRCEVTAIRFDFIVPKDAIFTCGDVTGRLREWKNLQGELWPNACSPESYMNYIVVAEIVQTS